VCLCVCVCLKASYELSIVSYFCTEYFVLNLLLLFVCFIIIKNRIMNRGTTEDEILKRPDSVTGDVCVSRVELLSFPRLLFLSFSLGCLFDVTQSSILLSCPARVFLSCVCFLLLLLSKLHD